MAERVEVKGWLYRVVIPEPEVGKPLVMLFEYPDDGERWLEALRILLEAGAKEQS